MIFGRKQKNSDAPIPIFIFTCDRIAVLRESLDSFRKIKPMPRFILHDNNSTYPLMLEYLDELEEGGVEVVRTGRSVVSNEDLNRIGETVTDWFSRNDAPYYIVTDPDIALEGGHDDILNAYSFLLQRFPKAEVVGPMLRIDDIPDHYPLKFVAAGRHYYQFWQKEPESIRWKGRRLQYQWAPIDTTFGMYRKGYKFRRLNEGLRVYAPYWARHLDWYIDPANMGDDQRWYMERASKVSHWGGSWLRSRPPSYVP